MVVVSHHNVVSNLLQERQRAMAETRFKPENFHEIHRVLGVRFAPDLSRVISKTRAHAASAYLKRLQRDVEKSQGGFYDKLQAMPLQIKRMKIHAEDTRNFRSILVPKYKLPALAESTGGASSGQCPPAPGASSKALSPKGVVVSPGDWAGPGALPPLVLPSGSSYVPHKTFSPHTNTHIHVLYKQGPGSITPRKGAGSVVSVQSSQPGGQGQGPPHSVADTKSSRRSSLAFHPQAKSTPRDNAAAKSKPPSEEDSASESGSSSTEDSPQPYSTLKLAADQPPLPYMKKQLFVNLMPRVERPKPVFSPEEERKLELSPTNRITSRKGSYNGIPPKVAAALAAGGNASTALYKFVLPSTLSTSHNSVPLERPRVVPTRNKNHLPLPSIPPAAAVKPVAASHSLLAITSVRPHVVQAAA